MAQQTVPRFARKNAVIAARDRTRTMPMEVLSLGYSRTGTMTMQAALEILGYPTWHNLTMGQDEQDLVMWNEALERKFVKKETLKREDFDRLLGSWSACTDQPACVFAAELVDVYPEAQVILVERDVEKWYKSFHDVIIEGSNNPVIPIMEKIDQAFVGGFAKVNDYVMQYIFEVEAPRVKWGIFNNPDYFSTLRKNARTCYRKHNEHVKALVKPGQLLKFRFEDGWEPLCKFLGKDIPAVPFPRVNETKAGQQLIQVILKEGYKRRAKDFLAGYWWLLLVPLTIGLSRLLH